MKDTEYRSYLAVIKELQKCVTCKNLQAWTRSRADRMIYVMGGETCFLEIDIGVGENQ